MTNPEVKIILSTDSKDSKVEINEQNISHLVQKVEVSQRVGELPHVTLHVISTKVALEIQSLAHVELVVTHADKSE